MALAEQSSFLKAFPERTKLIKQGSTSRHYKSVGVFIPQQKQVFGPVYMNDEDAVFLNDLENAGVDIIFQVLAEKKATSWEKIKAKQFPNLV